MDEIMNLLSEKNQCLEKFYVLNESQLQSIVSGNFESLDRFYQAREGLLDIIEKVDELVEKRASEIQPGSTQVEQRVEMETILATKNDWVAKILSQDLEILSAIDTAKSNIIKELGQVRSAKKAVGAYKSGSKTNSLDEEA